jgi:hypothetical protein
VFKRARSLITSSPDPWVVFRAKRVPHLSPDSRVRVWSTPSLREATRRGANEDGIALRWGEYRDHESELVAGTWAPPKRAAFTVTTIEGGSVVVEVFATYVIRESGTTVEEAIAKLRAALEGVELIREG